MQEIADGIHKTVFFKEGVDVFCPVALDEDTGHIYSHSAEQTAPRSGGRAETAVKTEDDHRSASAEPHAVHNGNEQKKVHREVLL